MMLHANWIHDMIHMFSLARRKARLKKHWVNLSVGTSDLCPPVAARVRAHKRDSCTKHA